MTGAENNEERVSALMPHESPSLSCYSTVHVGTLQAKKSSRTQSERWGMGWGGLTCPAS